MKNTTTLTTGIVEPFLFENSPSFSKMLIADEVGSQEALIELFENIENRAYDLYKEKATVTSYEQMTVLEEDAAERGGDERVTLDLDIKISLGIDFPNLSFSEYLEQLQLRIMHNVNYDSAIIHYDLSAEGLLAAISRYNQLVQDMDVTR